MTKFTFIWIQLIFPNPLFVFWPFGCGMFRWEHRSLFQRNGKLRVFPIELEVPFPHYQLSKRYQVQLNISSFISWKHTSHILSARIIILTLFFGVNIIIILSCTGSLDFPHCMYRVLLKHLNIYVQDSQMNILLRILCQLRSMDTTWGQGYGTTCWHYFFETNSIWLHKETSICIFFETWIH